MHIVTFPNWKQAGGLLLLVFLMACTSTKKNENEMKEERSDLRQGTYGYDVEFFGDNSIEIIELKEASGARVLLVPAYQGRVMTSATRGEEGSSFGWINYDLIASGETNDQFNPFGGEERLWLGPEGGPFSIYFAEGDDQVFENWQVPAALDTESFEVVSRTDNSVAFQKEFALKNASGMEMEIGIERTIKLLSEKEVESALNLSIDKSLSYVAYESENTLINKGANDWTKESGFLSIWLLSMFNPSEKGVVFVPFRKGSESEPGKVVTDDYFGKVPADRLIIRGGFVFFKVDGKYRSKIGISPQRALPYCGSYDEENNLLTLLWFSKPQEEAKYVNSKWGDQEDPLKGDVINSYNDGPVEDGSVMGPFYELESSSPAALLQAGEEITHTQRVFHITGNESKLNEITLKLFDLPVAEIKSVFNDGDE